MGLPVNVYRSALIGDCTNGGVSSVADTLVVVNVSGPFDPTPDRPAVLLTTNSLGNPILVPAKEGPNGWEPDRPEGSVGPMMGGNYGATSDSRFARATNVYGAIPLHDRFETPEQYAALGV